MRKVERESKQTERKRATEEGRGSEIIHFAAGERERQWLSAIVKWKKNPNLCFYFVFYFE